VLLGCGLRRPEAAALTMGHVQQRDRRRCIVEGRGRLAGGVSRAVYGSHASSAGNRRSENTALGRALIEAKDRNIVT
jgi:hypothetical protein